MIRHVLRVLACAAWLALPPSASHAVKFAGAFLDGRAGARALGMGNAFTAVADDASGIYWNPAGLASTNANELLVSHEFRFGDLVDYSFAGGIYQVRQRNGRLGLAVVRLGIDNISFPDSSLWHDDNHNGNVDAGEFTYDPTKIRYGSDAEYAVFLSYAQPVGRLQFGGSLKFIRQSVDTNSSFGLGLDLGVVRRGLIRNLDVGLTLHDVTGTYLAWSTGRKETIPIVPRLGFAYTHPSERLRGVLLLTGDVELHFDDRRAADQLWTGSMSANTGIGAEFTMQNRLALRMGLDERQFLTGAGLTAGPVQFDYGIVTNPRGDFDMSQRLSLRYVHAR